MERWKDILGYEGHYQISDHGRVKSMQREVPHKRLRSTTIKERIIKPGIRNGYEYVHLHLSNKIKTCKIHILVANHFIENVHNKPIINHLDSNPRNNHYNNLEWCTYSENNFHGWKYGNRVNKAAKGAMHVQSKRIAQITLKGQVIEIFPCLAEASKKTGINISMISMCANNRIRKTKNCKWQFV